MIYSSFYPFFSMKKNFIMFCGLMTAFFGVTAQAQSVPTDLPADAYYEFNVYNISQANKDATVVGARPGDTLKYEVVFGSDISDVEDFVTRVNVGEILQGATLIDAGLGTLEGNSLVFPSYSHVAPCQKKFSFFVRVKKDCGTLAQMSATANDAVTRTVTLECSEEKVIITQTGPSTWVVALIAFLVASVIIGVSVRANNKPA